MMTVKIEDGGEKYRVKIEGSVSKYPCTVSFLPSVLRALSFGRCICFNSQVQTHLVDPTQRTTFSQWAQSLTVGNP